MRKVVTPDTLAPPSLGLLAGEPVRAIFDLWASTRSLPAYERGDGHQVLVIPGIAAGPLSTQRFRKMLDRCGYASCDWGLGMNRGPGGDFDAWLASLESRLASLHATSGMRLSLIGWSLGGIYARELAKRQPRMVRQVITVATPFRDLRANRVSGVARLLNRSACQLTDELQRRFCEAPPVPTTALYSKTDGIVAWRACMAPEAGRSESIEAAGSSHWGMGMHPEVLRIILDRLAQPDGKWKRYHAQVAWRRLRARVAANARPQLP